MTQYPVCLQKIPEEMNYILDNVNIAFNYTKKKMLREIFTADDRLKISYASTVWSPHLRKTYRYDKAGPTGGDVHHM